MPLMKLQALIVELCWSIALFYGVNASKYAAWGERYWTSFRKFEFYSETKL